MFKPRGILLTATVLSSLLLSRPGWADGSVRADPVPPMPTVAEVDQAARTLGNPINQPVTGAAEAPNIVGGVPPPSLEALQAARPGDQHSDGLKPGRADELRQAALIYGAQGGLAGRAFAINEMLRRYQAVLDTTFDFRSIVLPVGSGQTLMRPPIISQAQLAFALGDGGQVAHETACIYEITREAQLTSAPPNWREYLVRSWAVPQRPADAALPRTNKEVDFWNKWVAEGWGQGEQQAVDIFLSDLNRLQRDITGMARYRVLLRSGLVEQPRVAFQNHAFEGGRDSLHVGDQVVRITDQPGLQGRRASAGYGCQ
jgi:defect-in-organelle-trafficking protein DotC